MSLTPIQLTSDLLWRCCLVGGTALCHVFFFSTAITTTQHLSKCSPAHAFGLIVSTLNLTAGLGVGATVLQRTVCLAGGRQEGSWTPLCLFYTFSVLLPKNTVVPNRRWRRNKSGDLATGSLEFMPGSNMAQGMLVFSSWLGGILVPNLKVVT